MDILISLLAILAIANMVLAVLVSPWFAIPTIVSVLCGVFLCKSQE